MKSRHDALVAKVIGTVRSYYVNQGRLQRDRDLSKGRMLVWTEEQWRERFSKQLWKRTKVLIVVMGIAFLAIILPLLSLAIRSPEVPLEVFLFLFVLITLVFGVSVPLGLVVTKLNFARAPAVGLYENGVQQSPYLFIPYIEIGWTERKLIGIGSFKQEVVMMHPRYKRKGFQWVNFPRPWPLLVKYIGEEGLRAMQERLSGAAGPRPRGPPELVLYGR